MKQQITDDFGQPAVLGTFRSRVLGIGPQMEYIFPIGKQPSVPALRRDTGVRRRQPAVRLEHRADVCYL
jgi:hypothetical protein